MEGSGRELGGGGGGGGGGSVAGAAGVSTQVRLNAMNRIYLLLLIRINQSQDKQ